MITFLGILPALFIVFCNKGVSQLGNFCRYQKLRKTAGLTVTDPVELYYDVHPDNNNGSTPDPLFLKVVSSQDAYFRECLGRSLVPSTNKPSDAVVIAEEKQVVGGDGARTEFIAILTAPTVSVADLKIEEVGIKMISGHQACCQ